MKLNLFQDLTIIQNDLKLFNTLNTLSLDFHETELILGQICDTNDRDGEGNPDSKDNDVDSTPGRYCLRYNTLIFST